MMFELKQSLNLKLQQQLVMTPQLQQAIRLLQLSRMELVEAIQQELEQNPALEEELRPDRAAIEEEAAISGDEPKTLASQIEPEIKPTEIKGDADNANDITGNSGWENYNAQPPQGAVYKQSTEDLPNLEQTLTRSEDAAGAPGLAARPLTDGRRRQRDRHEIIGALVDNGFLAGERPCEDVAIRLNVSVEHVERVLQRVQEFDTIGIAARDLTECLLLVQLKYFKNTNKLAERLVMEFPARAGEAKTSRRSPRGARSRSTRSARR